MEAVADQLRPGTYELDSLTFDAGLLNSQAISKALQRCDLFCLFLSSNSASSSYVDLEILLGMELIAKGQIARFLAVCIDEKAFASASANVRMFNIVRKQPSVEGAARLIQGTLVSVSRLGEQIAHPFIGREEEMLELEKQIADHNRPLPKGIFISGNFGAGRRTVARKFYQDQYPHVSAVMPTLNIPPFSGMKCSPILGQRELEFPGLWLMSALVPMSRS